jgi:membrane protein
MELLRRVLREQSSEQVGLSASGAAFWLVITVLPTAIAAVSLYGLVVSPQRVADNLAGLADNGPQSLGVTLADQLKRVAAGSSTGLTVGFIVSILLALWSASAGVYNLGRAIRSAYGVTPEMYVRARGRAFVGAIVVVLAVGVLALLSTAAAMVGDSLPTYVGFALGIPVVVALLAAVIVVLYRYSVGRKIKIGAQWPGAISSAVGLVIVIAGFGVYLRHSTRYTAVYGALAGTVIGMIGTYLSVYVVLLGAVLNAQLAEMRAIRAGDRQMQ